MNKNHGNGLKLEDSEAAEGCIGLTVTIFIVIAYIITQIVK